MYMYTGLKVTIKKNIPVWLWLIILYILILILVVEVSQYITIVLFICLNSCEL